MRPKNPRTPPDSLIINDSDIFVYPTTRALFRIHTIHGHHPMPWNGLRQFGPLPQMRWDPHPMPIGTHPGVGIAYCASDPTTAFAEVFQSRRIIRLNNDQALSGWLPVRALRLLNLTGGWATANGASASLHAAPKTTCQAWARAIHEQAAPLHLDGLYAPSTMTLDPMVVLFYTSEPAFPIAPDFSELLNHSTVRAIALKAAQALRWVII